MIHETGDGVGHLLGGGIAGKELDRAATRQHQITLGRVIDEIALDRKSVV